jgi:hypothetical protein
LANSVHRPPSIAASAPEVIDSEQHMTDEERVTGLYGDYGKLNAVCDVAVEAGELGEAQVIVGAMQGVVDEVTRIKSLPSRIAALKAEPKPELPPDTRRPKAQFISQFRRS